MGGDDTGGWVRVRILPWCLAPNGIREERWRKGGKGQAEVLPTLVNHDRIQLQRDRCSLTPSIPPSFTPHSLRPRPPQLLEPIFFSFYCPFLLLPLPPQSLLPSPVQTRRCCNDTSAMRDILHRWHRWSVCFQVIQIKKWMRKL